MTNVKDLIIDLDNFQFTATFTWLEGSIVGADSRTVEPLYEAIALAGKTLALGMAQWGQTGDTVIATYEGHKDGYITVRARSTTDVAPEMEPFIQLCSNILT